VDLTPVQQWLTFRFFLIDAFAAHVLEVMHAVRVRALMGTIEIVSRLERRAFLSDKEAASCRRSAAV
jgi:hypothetical protein